MCPTLVYCTAGTKINGGTFTIPPALGNKTFHPFGDFLLHDVGTGDGIVIPTRRTLWTCIPPDATGMLARELPEDAKPGAYCAFVGSASSYPADA